MTNKEASDILDDYDVNFDGHTAEEVAKAFDVAFRALDQESILDKIRAEIESYKESLIDWEGDSDLGIALRIIDKYREGVKE